jgi:Ni2+-binding GTPase involved in maturation of urease and hydrogenase
MPYGYKGHYHVVGPPGTGKTTFLASQVEQIVEKSAGFIIGDESPVLLCSMTRAAAADHVGRRCHYPRSWVSQSGVAADRDR